jgi:hypothetical protein
MVQVCEIWDNDTNRDTQMTCMIIFDVFAISFVVLDFPLALIRYPDQLDVKLP